MKDEFLCLIRHLVAAIRDLAGGTQDKKKRPIGYGEIDGQPEKTFSSFKIQLS